MEIQGFNIREATKLKGKIILLADFNIHVDTQVDMETLLFTDFLDAMTLRNHAEFSTHNPSIPLT